MSYGFRLWVESSSALNSKRLNDETAISSFLKDIISLAGMQLAGGPFTYKEMIRDIGKGPGVTGVAILIESSVHIHTYPNQQYIFFELFSCKEFDEDKILDFIRAFAGCEDLDYEMKEIGENFPIPVNST